MTREQFEDVYKDTSSKQLRDMLYATIKKYENRSCESCKYCDKGQNIQWCDNPEVNKYRNMAHRVDLDFYCKYWSAKDDKNI